MLRFNPTRRFVPAFILALGVVLGCSDDEPTAPRQAFTLVSESPSYSLKPGESKKTFVKAVRVNGFAGQITFGLNAAGAGLNAGMQVSTTADSAAINLTAISTGAYSVLVMASAAGYATASLTIPVTVAP